MLGRNSPVVKSAKSGLRLYRWAVLQTEGCVILNGILVASFEISRLYLAGFLKFWSVTFVVVTTLVMLFKHETEARTRDEDDVADEALTQSVSEAYMQLWRIVHLPAVLSLIAMLLTYKVKCRHRAHVVITVL